MSVSSYAMPKVVSREEWTDARKELLVREKEMTRAMDALAAERRRLPMVEIDKDYTFEGPSGKVRLLDMFEGRRQLIIYHFMFDPNDPPPGKHEPFDEGCSGCSFEADNVPKYLEHLHARDTSFAMVSRAPLAKIEPFKKRMGWTMPWVSSFGSSFNYDFHVTIDESVAPVEYNYYSKEELAEKKKIYHMAGEQPGLSVFYRDGERIFHTYSTYGRGLEVLLTTYRMLDLTPLGRQEPWENPLEGGPKGGMDWIRHHDKYEDAAADAPCCRKEE